MLLSPASRTINLPPSVFPAQGGGSSIVSSVAACILRGSHQRPRGGSITTDPRFDLPLYNVSEAARLARVPTNTLRNWLHGYGYPSAGRMVATRPVVHPTVSQPTALSFINLMETVALAGFRETGVSMQRVRRALEYVGKQMREKHPLANERVLTDGVDLFWEFQTREPTDVHLVNISRGGQKAFPEAVKRYLREVEWGKDRFATRWWPGAVRAGRGPVVVDPRRAFGSPVVARTGIRTADIFQRFAAGEPLSEIAEDYGLSGGKVEAAIRAEARFLEPVAA